jgi:hypothetical protein
MVAGSYVAVALGLLLLAVGVGLSIELGNAQARRGSREIA